jgi:hypothetical protein
MAATAIERGTASTRRIRISGEAADYIAPRRFLRVLSTFTTGVKPVFLQAAIFLLKTKGFLGSFGESPFPGGPTAQLARLRLWVASSRGSLMTITVGAGRRFSRARRFLFFVEGCFKLGVRLP